MARFYRKRRGSKGLWYPVQQGFTTASIDLNAGDAPTIGDYNFDIVSVVQGNIPVNTDGDEAIGQLANTPAGLAFLEGTGFTVKRIVGSIFVSCSQNPASTVETVECVAGFFIDRVSQDGTPELAQNWDPARVSSTRKRWLWKRHWILSNSQEAAPDAVPNSFPLTNAEYGDIRSGTHVDAKCMGRVGAQEMLFYMSAVRIASMYSEENINQFVRFTPRIRVFASRPYPARNRE